MSEHSPKIRTPSPEELEIAIKAAERRGAFLMVGALRELQQFRAAREATIKHVHEVTVAELKHQLEQDRKARSQV